ncbi:hypothetical protein BB934_40280 (plasmid) [Microvirga ossetica]|uniref:Group II intron maturase-specific domain-containing protein n=1 Tax=Microvirga ossetica TaxID=1882682 RepID=A0A1B2EWU0_9HYPH|nr:group II intron maturase-specific domain-containing protein [Microvirga ossetica]ANY84442.1 hypothetical protein BB934_40280 [Microvirga ossetica]
MQRLKTKVANLLTPGHNEPWWDVRDRLNRSLRGWSNYFSYGTCRPAFRGMDQYVTERVRAFLARRHKVQLVRDYVGRGRSLESVSIDQLRGEWVAFMRAWVTDPHEFRNPKRADIESEFTL